MVPKRQISEGVEGNSEFPIKRRHLLSTIFKGVNTRNLQDYMPNLESRLQKWVKEEVDHAFDPFLRSSYDHIECSRSRTLQLRFDNKPPHTLFTGSTILSEDGTPVKIIMYDSTTNKVVKSGPSSSIKLDLVVLDGDFVPDHQEDWSKNDFNRKVVQNRQGKRPLLTGELTVPLHNGVGYIGEASFTDNSSWIRCGKFRLGVKVHSGFEETSIREGVSNAFKVKDHRGESYKKHHPPSLDDEVWRLERIAKDGASHKRLTQSGISCVRDFLRLYFTNQISLRSVLRNISNKTWETIVRHATACTLDDKKYIYKDARGNGLLFNSICKVVGVTFDGHSYHSIDCLDMYQMRIVEDLKQHAYRNINDWIDCDPSVVGYPMLLANPASINFNSLNLGPQDANFNVEQEIMMNTHHPTMSETHNSATEQDNSSFELGESSQMQGFNFGMSDFHGVFYTGEQSWDSRGNNYMESDLSTEDITVDDNFQVDSSA